MGVIDKILGKGKKGIQCERLQNGDQMCTRFEVIDGQKVSTGTSATFSVDSSTCNVAISGDVNSFMDDEANDFNNIKKSLESGCRRGIA